MAIAQMVIILMSPRVPSAPPTAPPVLMPLQIAPNAPLQTSCLTIPATAIAPTVIISTAPSVRHALQTAPHVSILILTAQRVPLRSFCLNLSVMATVPMAITLTVWDALPVTATAPLALTPPPIALGASRRPTSMITCASPSVQTIISRTQSTISVSPVIAPASNAPMPHPAHALTVQTAVISTKGPARPTVLLGIMATPPITPVSNVTPPAIPVIHLALLHAAHALAPFIFMGPLVWPAALSVPSQITLITSVNPAPPGAIRVPTPPPLDVIPVIMDIISMPINAWCPVPWECMETPPITHACHVTPLV